MFYPSKIQDPDFTCQHLHTFGRRESIFKKLHTYMELTFRGRQRISGLYFRCGLFAGKVGDAFLMSTAIYRCLVGKLQ